MSFAVFPGPPGEHKPSSQPDPVTSGPWRAMVSLMHKPIEVPAKHSGSYTSQLVNSKGPSAFYFVIFFIGLTGTIGAFPAVAKALTSLLVD